MMRHTTELVRIDASRPSNHSQSLDLLCHSAIGLEVVSNKARFEMTVALNDGTE